MIVKDILRVIYSPVKAFESIAKKPNIKGPFIILALILVCAAIEQYALASKIFLATRTPKNDEWTESISSSWIWSSNGNISIANVTYGGDFVRDDHCVKSVVSNNASIWMNITNIGSLNCSGDEGYKRLSFWINWTHQSRTVPSDSKLRLLSTNESKYFELSLANLISNSSGEWSILVSGVGVGLDSQEDWVSSADPPSWEKITGLEFVLKWADSANLTMNINGLYFLKKPFSFLTTTAVSEYIVSALIFRIDPPSTVIGFFLMWIIYVGSFFIVSSGAHQKLGSWRALFSVIGYVFAVAIVGILVRAILYSTLPALSFPVDSWTQMTHADSIQANLIIEYFWYPETTFLWSLLAKLGLDVWIAAICAVSMRSLGGLSWKRAAMFAAFAYFIKIFLFNPGSMI